MISIIIWIKKILGIGNWITNLNWKWPISSEHLIETESILGKNTEWNMELINWLT